MRSVIFEKIKHRMQEDPRLFFLTGDTGYHLVEPLFDKYNDRTLNVGVAEQNLMGLAAGLCKVGFIPICYGITNFLVHRCLEQLRNDICLHRHQVIIIGSTTGFDNGALGATHHMLDDIGCLKALPNLNIYSPSGKRSAELVFNEALDSDVACFIRVPKSDFVESGPVVRVNHLMKETTQKETLLLSHGKMVQNCLKAAEDGHFDVFAHDCLKPLDHKVLEDLFNIYPNIAVVEDNFRSGLYNSICQWAVETHQKNRNIFSIAPREGYARNVGSADFLESRYGLSPQSICRNVQRLKDENLNPA